MIAVFIDTNVFQKMNYNFDKRNIILKNFKTLIKNREIKNVIISVIDNEIKEHLTNRKKENEKVIKKYCKWVYDEIDKKKIENNLSKEILDYQKFKEETSSIIINVDNINPEIVLNKYFLKEFPFEPSKPQEFKDAFFVEAVFEYAKQNFSTKYVVISEDKGIKKAIEKNGNLQIIQLESLPQLMDLIINYGNKRKKDIKKYLSNSNLTQLLQGKVNVSYDDIEEETIEVEETEVVGVLDLDIINVYEDYIRAVCNLFVALRGTFKCLDYNNSYFSDEDNEYIYKNYIDKKELSYVCLTVIDIKTKNDEYADIIIKDFPEIEIEFDDLSDDKEFL